MNDRPPVRPWPPRPAAVLLAFVAMLLTFRLAENGVGGPVVRFRAPDGFGRVQVVEVRHALRIGLVETTWRVADRRPFVAFGPDERSPTITRPATIDGDGGIVVEVLDRDGAVALRTLDPSTLVAVGSTTEEGPVEDGSVAIADLISPAGGGIRWTALALVLLAGVVQAGILACVGQWAWAWIDRRRPRRCADDHGPRCSSCGYALVGSTAGRCPECGHAAAPDEPA